MRYIKILLRDFYQVWRITDWRTFFRYLKNFILCGPEIWRTRTFKSANERMQGELCRFSFHNNKEVTLDGRFFGIAKEIYCRGVYFVLPGFSIEPDDCVVDFGAHIGAFTTLAAVCAKRVVSVEAQAGLVPVIESNLRQNKCLEKVNLEWGLIGARTGLFSDPARRQAASHFVKEPPSITVSELFARHRLERVDFLKIDIEGSEYALFDGDTDWLKIVRRIAMEVHFDFGDPDRLTEQLKQAGFEVWLMNNDQRIVSTFKPRNGAEGGYIFAKKKIAGCPN
jgi:FkbM family methyltransferase